MNRNDVTRRTLGLIASACVNAAGLSAFAAPVATPPQAQARLLAALRQAHPGTEFSAVAPTPIAGLYEAWMGPNLAFVSDTDVRYLIFGRLFDTRTMTDLTAPKLANAEQQGTTALDNASDAATDAAAIPVASLPLADAITVVHGAGRRPLFVFSDPACPYCQRLAPELERLDNVTIHTFLVPFQGSAWPEAIWCAADRAHAWQAAMMPGAAAPPGTPHSCAHPLERNRLLAHTLHVHGTPTLVYADGSRTDGFAETAAIETRLAQAATTTAQALP